MKNYKVHKKRLSKKSLYLSIIFITLSTILIVVLAIRRSLNSSNIVDINAQKSYPTELKQEYVPKAENLYEKPEELRITEKTAEDHPTKQQKETKPKVEKNNEQKTITPSEIVKNQNKKIVKPTNKGVFKLTKPIDGEILQKFSDTTPVLNPISDVWQPPKGIDIAATPNSPVKAAASGTVLDITDETDYNGGVSITLLHDDNYKTIYSGLSKNNVKVKIDSKVSAGDIIGSVGTNKISGIIEPHLHFEVQKGDDFIDPLKFLKF